MFNKNRLCLARKRRKLSAKELAERAGLSAMTVSRLEKGENQPDGNTVARLARALNFPPEFFYADDPEDIDTCAASFRSLSRMSVRERDAALSAGAISSSHARGEPLKL